jgi:hypothetical protein
VNKEKEMPVPDITEITNTKYASVSKEKNNPTGFSRVLGNAVTEANGKLLKQEHSENSGTRHSAQTAFIEIGKISKETPTVSHILKNHPDYTKKCWDIIFASENQGKPFNKMQEGTVVALKKGSNELLWGRQLSRAAKIANDESSVTSRDKGPGDKTKIIGTISRDNPTVSHLFQANNDFDNRFWDIIHAPVNSSKKYTSLNPGTRVSFNRETMELSFTNNSAVRSAGQTEKIIMPKQIANNDKVHYDSLAAAVKPFIGKPYNEIDCYGLVVRGLINQGVQYHGNGGLREKLEALANINGLPNNAYLNGEGLVEKAGTKLFSKSMRSVSNTREKTDRIYSEMTPFLREGLILSFSTPTRGHTGIVSRQGEDWTYINSGLIDNEVSPGRVSERVGEEILKKEIKNWFVLAAGRKEPLTVTLGRLDKDQLQDFVSSKDKNKLASLKMY